MVKKNKKNKTTLSYEEERELKNQKTVKIFAWGLLIIMGLTLISWSMIGYAPSSSHSQNRNVPFTQNIFQDSVGNTYDGAILDGIQFIFFEDVTQYAQNEELITIANTLTSFNVPIVYEYVDESFDNDDARFLISQGLSVNGLSTSLLTTNLSCEVPTIIYTTNESRIDNSNNCITFYANSTQVFSLANGLTYHLIKDIQ